MIDTTARLVTRLVTTGTGWSLIIAGLIMAVIFGIAAYGYLGPIPAPLDVICTILFWVGIILLVIGIIIVLAVVIRRASGT